MINISIINESNCLKDEDIKSALQSLQIQISRDFYPVWGIDALLEFGNNSDSWQMVILDNSDQAGALGYHDLTSQGLPMGKVFAETDLKYGNSWTVTLSHELLEIIADPEINLCATANNKLYAYEVCDAVESDSLGYKIGDILVSNFVYPSWFSPSFKGPYDQCNLVTKPLELLSGGYISVMDLGDSNWHQITADSSQSGPKAPIGSRRERRTNKNQWKLSKKGEIK